MNKVFLLFAILLFFPLINIFSQDFDQMYINEDDLPYLTDDDIRAVESALSDDVMIRRIIPPAPVPEEHEKTETESASASAQQEYENYYLVILDRRSCSPNADISGINTANILFKYLHNTNDNLVLVYKAFKTGEMIPVYPYGSRVLFEFMSIDIDPIKKLADSDLIKDLIPQDNVQTALRFALEK